MAGHPYTLALFEIIFQITRAPLPRKASLG
jgi:hypothetical protein